METWNRLTATREQGVEGKWWKEGEGISQRTCMNDPWTWTRVWGLTVGAGCGLSGEGQMGKNWKNCNRIMINFFKKTLLSVGKNI